MNNRWIDKGWSDKIFQCKNVGMETQWMVFVFSDLNISDTQTL